MIIILAFAVWTLLLAVVGVVTGVSFLMHIAAAIGVLAAGSALFVLFIEMRRPTPRLVRRPTPTFV